MPRYFFHTEDGTCARDEQGTELPDDHAARNEAVVVLAELVKENPDEFWSHAAFTLSVTDSSGLTLYILDLAATASPAAAQPQRAVSPPTASPGA